jgi:CHAT domain
MPFEGAQMMVMKTITRFQKQPGTPVDDAQIAQDTNIALQDVRDWLLTLMKDRYVDLVRTQTGFAASVNERGRLELALYEPFTTAGQAAPASRLEFTQRTILLLAANPKGTIPLRLDEEAKKIEQGLERSKNRDKFRLVMKWAVTADELRRALLDYEPEIVHFSGHGSGVDGLNFEDDQGFPHEIPGDALDRLFELMTKHVKCVVLNACYSEVQADAIARHIGTVIGMKQAIGDEAAIKFAVGFYDAIAAGRDYDDAFKWGQGAIDLAGIKEDLTPVLKRKP